MMETPTEIFYDFIYNYAETGNLIKICLKKMVDKYAKKNKPISYLEIATNLTHQLAIEYKKIIENINLMDGLMSFYLYNAIAQINYIEALKEYFDNEIDLTVMYPVISDLKKEKFNLIDNFQEIQGLTYETQLFMHSAEKDQFVVSVMDVDQYALALKFYADDLRDYFIEHFKSIDDYFYECLLDYELSLIDFTYIAKADLCVSKTNKIEMKTVDELLTEIMYLGAKEKNTNTKNFLKK